MRMQSSSTCHPEMARLNINGFILVLVLATARKGEAKVSAVIAFGDSSVDSGNNNFIPTVARSNFRPYGRDFYGGRATGRFSNGRVPTDIISQGLGLKTALPAYLDPKYNISDFATGVCFASAGSGFDPATSDVLSVISLSKELEYYTDYQKRLRGYLGAKRANKIVAEALHVISAGTNDFLENYYTMPDRRSQYSVGEYQDFLVGIAGKFVRDLYGLGARRVSLGGLPPMGCLPLERTMNFFSGSDCNEMHNKVATDFNAKLAGLTVKLNKELAGMKMVFSNPYGAFLNVIQDPSAYGFEVADQGCCATGMYEMGYACDQNTDLTCTDADKYVFWDAFHPTQRMSGILVAQLFKKPLSVFLRGP